MDLKDYLSIVVSVIATLIGFYEWHKNKNIKKITDSRRMWRDQLREYVIELKENKNNTDELRKTLAKIKVRINTLGFGNQKFSSNVKIKDKINYFQNDGYIWECIQNLDDKIKKNQNNTSGNNGGLYDSEVDKLINCISLLLKSDWDRSKHEIGLVSNQLIFPVVAIVNILNYSYVVYLFECKEFPIATLWMIALAILPIVLCLVVYEVVIWTKKSCKHCEKKIKALRLLCRILVIVVSFLLITYVIGDNKSMDNVILNGLCLFTSLVNYIYVEKNVCNYLKNIQYVNALEAIMGDNQNTDKSKLIEKISMLCEKMIAILSRLNNLLHKK